MDEHRKAQLARANAQLEALWNGKGSKALRETTYRGLCWATALGEPTQAQIDAALGTAADALSPPQWVAYNATDESAPADQPDTWTVAKIDGHTVMDWKFIRGLTRGYAESLAESLNRRDLKTQLHASLVVQR